MEPLAPVSQRRRMLVIVNPYATTVSDRLKNLIVYALQSRYDVEAVDTRERDHATELCARAKKDGFDVVVAFGGDGTANEVANGLLHTDVPITCLPGGMTNVFGRSIGVPGDVVDATEHLLRMADRFEPRRIDVGTANGRAFVFSAGVGIDAAVVKLAEDQPELKARFGEWFYMALALGTYGRKYLVKPPQLTLNVPGREPAIGVGAVFQNANEFTFFGSRPLVVCEGAGSDTGTLSAVVLDRANVVDLPTLIWRLLSKRGQVSNHRHIQSYPAFTSATVKSVDGNPLPVHVDGDYIGHFIETRIGIKPGALTVVS